MMCALFKIFSVTAMSIPIVAAAQQTCANGIRIEGLITDSSSAVIAKAVVQAANGDKAITDGTGHFQLACVPKDAATITVQAEGFSSASATAQVQSDGTARLNLQLEVARVNADVVVNADNASMDIDHTPGSRTLTATDIQQLPDDPDDLAQQLQLMASSGGAVPDLSTITIDGFQNPGVLPPKSAIASIRVNADRYSPEYEQGNTQSGAIEIFTKPGADTFHGALFFNDNDGSFNANDPFSTTATPAGKRRYGFELSGPLIPKRSGFALALEKRDIDEFNIVNAVTLDANLNQTPLHQSIDAPQRLWIASARGDWQANLKDVATLSYSANVNDRGNQGVGGLVLPEAGYSSLVSEYDLRLTNMFTINQNLLHETRIGYSWKRTAETPSSGGPALQVAGYFVGGGNTDQNLDEKERDLEIDDDILISHGKHSWKLGVQSLAYFVHNSTPDTFNGAYVFGGGIAPVLDSTNSPTSQTTTISGMEQYRRALLNLAGGVPTTYQVTTGNPALSFAQWRVALFALDTFKVTPRLTATAGLRYQFQTTPESAAGILPRVGLAWSFDQKSAWVFHLRAGLFNTPLGPSYPAQVYRLDGVHQQSTFVYSPSYAHPLTPASGSIQVGTRWQFPHALGQMPSAWIEPSVEGELPYNLHPSAWFTYGSMWGNLLTKNINSPMIGNGAITDPTAALLAPRPITPNINIFEYQNSSHLKGVAMGGGIDERGKRFRLNLGYWYVNFKSDGGWTGAVSPQSTYSKQGESSRPDGQAGGALAENDLHLPYKIDLSTEFYLHTGVPYNITTGTDTNGDGIFNDRPSYAPRDDSAVYNTAFGSLSTNSVNGNVPRNIGSMPNILHMYTNLSRAFNIGSKDSEHIRTLTFNARGVNLLNHTNVTAVGTVVSSPTLSQPLAAEAARRIELGMRFAF